MLQLVTEKAFQGSTVSGQLWPALKDTQGQRVLPTTPLCDRGPPEEEERGKRGQTGQHQQRGLNQGGGMAMCGTLGA